MDVEHALSDRAVRETAGQVLVHQGRLVDALYSSSCGGHTENVEVVFPLKSHVYLRGVPCPESGVDSVSGTLALGTPLVAGLMQRLLPAPGGDAGPAAAEARLRGLATLAGLPASRGTLASLDRRDVRRFVGSLFDLVLDARLLAAGAESSALLVSPPPEWSEEDLRLAAYLDRTGLLSAPIDGELATAELEEMLFQLSLYLGVLETRSGGFLSRDANELLIKGQEGVESLPLTDQLATFRGGEYNQRSAPLVLRPGDPVTAYLREGELVALAQQVDGDLAEGSPGAEVKIWHRRHSDSYLRRTVSTRYPEIDFAGFEVLERGVSGRVGRIRLHGRGGRSLEVEGLAIRWTLDLPDTLFTARRLEPSGQEAGWLFTGRGHGHGVGMCQLGAYGMGLRGSSYRDILHHYYSGVSIVDLELVERSAAAAP
jgi:stage II sporulation protein D